MVSFEFYLKARTNKSELDKNKLSTDVTWSILTFLEGSELKANVHVF